MVVALLHKVGSLWVGILIRRKEKAQSDTETWNQTRVTSSRVECATHQITSPFYNSVHAWGAGAAGCWGWAP